MFCSKCGTKLPDKAQFCGSCGAKIKEEAKVHPEQPKKAEGKSDPPAGRAGPPRPSCLFYLLSFVFSLFGILVGLFYIIRGKKTRGFGFKCLFLGITSLIIFSATAFTLVVVKDFINQNVPPELREQLPGIIEQIQEQMDQLPSQQDFQSGSLNQAMTPKEVVEVFTECTLVRNPPGQCPYDSRDQAKQHLVAELQARFNEATFIPFAYCIQDGPDDAKVTSEDITAESASLQVGGLYGGDWQDLWVFDLVKEGQEWKIKAINCRQ